MLNMLDELKKCLNNNNFETTTNIYKQTNDNITMDVKKNNKYYVCKALFTNNIENGTMKTEIETLKYFTKNKLLTFFPKYIDSFNCKNIQIVIMERLNGALLIDFKEHKLNNKFWLSLLYQLILIIYILEDNKILHNDFWDANIILVSSKKPISITYNDIVYDIPFCGFIVKVIDFQYTNQYSKNSKIRSKIVMSNSIKYRSEKKRLGWSSKFHIGGDLNQILGILTEYNSIPHNIKKLLNSIVIKTAKTDFPYAIQKGNKYTSGKYLLDNFKILFNI